MVYSHGAAQRSVRIRVNLRFTIQNAEFNAGYLTEYEPSMITTDNRHQKLAEGYPWGRRFKSAMTGRVCDLVPMQIGHDPLRTAAGGYVFADDVAPGAPAPAGLGSLGRRRAFARTVRHQTDSSSVAH